MRLLQRVLISLIMCSVVACSQNGPTQPSVQLNWTQSTSTGVTANCVYRGSVAGTYAMPAIFCAKVPITTYTDTTVLRGTTYHYAVTAQIASVEGNFSNDAVAPVPSAPNAPTVLTPAVITEIPGKDPILNARVVWSNPHVQTPK
jgi:fibronectin type 3 domain-containing protein